eukprot:GHVS01049383.1.p1 GENE.GHVS01049383.1~~GHVS01049383.1.p1  ORF type:complete len:518 (+),score=84.08 GHVS01049383.1:203-1756(+)
MSAAATAVGGSSPLSQQQLPTSPSVNGAAAVGGANKYATAPGGVGGNGLPAAMPPPVEIKLFVGRVPRTFDEMMLRPIFSDFGQVGDVIIIRDRDTGAHKGCAFIRMASITKADLAIRALNNVKVLDQSLGPLQVKYAAGEAERLGLPADNGSPGHDQAKLFVGSLPKMCTEDDIKTVFCRFGDIDEVFIMKDDCKGRSGCAFVKFSYKEAAFHAIANLNGKFTMNGSSRAMEVRFAENKKAQAHQQMALLQSRVGQTSNLWTEYFTNDGRPYYYHGTTGHTQWDRPPEMDIPTTPSAAHQAQLTPSSVVSNVPAGAVGAQTHGPPGANVFVFHVPNEWSEVDMLSHFAVYGQIVSARIAADKSTGRNKGFGFISFGDVAAAVNAVQGMNGYSANGKRLKVQIKKGEEQYADAYLPGISAMGCGGSNGGNNGGSGRGMGNAMPQGAALSALNSMAAAAALNNQPQQMSPNYPSTMSQITMANALATAAQGGRGGMIGGAGQQQGYTRTLAQMSAAYQ